MQYKSILLFASSALAAVHEVAVGKSGLSFEPQTISAAAGDKVIFTLYRPHDVAQSSFDKPCANDGGFFSGTYSQSKNGALRFVVTVNNTDPIYYYCSVSGHCAGGQVGGINIPSSGNTIDAYASAAKNAKGTEPSAITGGIQVTEAEASALLASASSSASATATASSTGTHSGSSASRTATASGSASGTSTAASATASATGAASHMGSSAMLAAAGAVAAWVL